MRTAWSMASGIFIAASFFHAQLASPAGPVQAPDGQPMRVMVYTVGPDVTAPELLSSIADAPLSEKCKKNLAGAVEFSLLIDTAGKPRNISYLRSAGSPVDQIALQLVGVEQFKPGEHDGVPVVVVRSVELELRACVAEVKDSAGKKTGRSRLLSRAEQKWGTPSQVPAEAVLTSVMPTSSGKPLSMQTGGDIVAPRALNTVPAQFSDEARKAKYQGVCLISLTVDEQGVPRDVRVIKAIGMGLDEKAIEAVSQYRFSPGMEYGVAVPVAFVVEVNFKLYASPSQHQH